MAKNSITQLKKIDNISDLKKLSMKQLPRLADEIRQFIIQTVSKTGGHLAPSLGVVELTVALHYLFDSPKDKIIWDVGHQSYAHKILTGRRDKFHTLRQYRGLSGFPKISESEHDAYGTGHASTSISAALGFAKARDLRKQDYEVVAIIGDGAFTGGNALEAINQAGYINTKLIVILNDNRMSISKNVGAFSEYTHRIEKTETYKRVKKSINKLIKKGDGLKEELMSLKAHIKAVGTPGLLFEKLGLNYIGPVDGHNIEEMLDSFQKAKKFNGPSLIHIRTIKGKGYSLAEQNKSKFHGVDPFKVENGESIRYNGTQSFTEIFADTLINIAEQDDSIVGITAAMPDGTGLSKFKERFPERFFDVGIAEQHAVVFAAGLARQGLKPVVAIYSSFLQRAYDAIVHDVCLQELPVVFAIDRAGIVGNDGPTHHGVFDLSYLRHIPNLVVMAPKDEQEFRSMLFTAIKLGKPVAVRYPRGCCFNVKKKNLQFLHVGRSEVVKEGNTLTIVSIGTVFQEALRACEVLEKKGIKTTLINSRFAKPLDNKIADYISRTGKAIIIEENSLRGGFGSAVLELCQENNIKADIELVGIPDRFIEHGSQEQLRKDCGLHYENIVRIAENLNGAGEPGELLTVVDEKDNIIGYEKKQRCHQGEGLLHRAFSIFIFNEHKQLLIQKRSVKKMLWPLHWSNSVCSHARKKEDCEEACLRRLKEELGFETPLQLLFKFQYQARFNNVGSENEICSVYIGKANGFVRADQNEIAEWRYIDVEKLNEDLLARPDFYTPWFRMEWERIQKYHQIDIENL